MTENQRSEEAGLHALLQRMSPGISDLMVRMMTIKGLTWPQARAFRDEIVELNKTAHNDEEQTALVFAFHSLMNRVEDLDLIDPSSLQDFRNAREADYRMLLSVQAMVGEMIDPIRLELVTRREVESGRLAADNDFRQFAIKSAQNFTKPKGSWFRRLFGKG
jgi:hypothetical protein